MLFLLNLILSIFRKKLYTNLIAFLYASINPIFTIYLGLIEITPNYKSDQIICVRAVYLTRILEFPKVRKDNPRPIKQSRYRVRVQGGLFFIPLYFREVILSNNIYHRDHIRTHKKTSTVPY